MSGTMVLAPTPVLQFFDDNGVLLSGGLLFSYAAGTTTKQSCFTDSTGDTSLPNPIVLNSRGEVAPSATSASCGLWLDPSLEYKFVLAPSTAGDPPTSQFWTVDNVVSAEAPILAALANYEATIGGVPIGAQMAYGGSSAPNGWLLCYGQAISRTTYALLFAIIGIAYGEGDGSSTFNLPDKRGRVSIGTDDMGGTPANRITEAVCGLDGTALGAAGGGQLAQADNLTATSSAVSVLTSGSVNVNNGSISVYGGPNIEVCQTAGSTQNYPVVGASVVTSVTTTVTSSLTGDTQNVQPSEIDNWIIFSGVGG
jgi:microcystin-dependent protein